MNAFIESWTHALRARMPSTRNFRGPQAFPLRSSIERESRTHRMAHDSTSEPNKTCIDCPSRSAAGETSSSASGACHPRSEKRAKNALPRASSEGLRPEMARKSAEAGKSTNHDASDEDSRTVFSTGDLARECRTTVRTVRFYEEAGLIAPLERTGGAHRMFTRGQLAKLQLITDLREAGFSISEIKDLFGLRTTFQSAPEATEKMSALLEERIEGIQQKIASLRRLRDEMAAMQAALSECQPCDVPDFVERCPTCDVTNRASAPRAMRLLWGNEE